MPFQLIMRQHYVPQCYLKMFINKSDKAFYVLNKEDLIKFGNSPKPNVRNPYQIASEKNFYTIDFKLTHPKSILDNLYFLAIERSFQLYEIKYPKIINKVIARENITNEEAFILSYSFIDFKLRNKYYRTNSIEKNKERLFDDVEKDFLTDVRREILTKFNATLEDAQMVFKKLKEEAIQNQHFSKEQHLSGLAEKRQNPESASFKIAKEILKSSWTLIHSDNTDFVTSDNPGYCVDSDENVHNTKFEKGFTFIIPISNQFCLFIDNNKITELLEANPINYFKCNNDLIRLINKGSSYFVNKYIISNNKSTLILLGNQILNVKNKIL